MAKKKGFTLIEIIVVMVIAGIVTYIAIINYTTYMEQGMAQGTKNNLLAIIGAEKNYYFNNGTYYYSPGVPGHEYNDDKNGIKNNLSLIINDPNYSYYCYNPSHFTCRADRTNGSRTMIWYFMTTLNGIPGLTPYCFNATHPEYCPPGSLMKT